MMNHILHYDNIQFINSASDNLSESHMNRQSSADLLNISQTWVHCLLYYANLYPQQAFHFKTIYGIEVPISRSRSVNQYIDSIFKSVKASIDSLNFIEVLLSEQKDNREEDMSHQKTRTFRFYFLMIDPENIEIDNRLQRELELKRFMNEIKMYFESQRQKLGNWEWNWKFRMEYRFQGLNMDSSSILDPWVAKDHKQIEESVINSLKFTNCQIIATEGQ